MKILVIEDSEADQVLLHTRLQLVHADNLELKFVSTLEEGRSALASESFDLVFLDKMLPDCGSNETIVEFLKQYPFQKIVMLTADEDENNIFQCVRAGALDFLIKPLLRDTELKRILLYAESTG